MASNDLNQRRQLLLFFVIFSSYVVVSTADESRNTTSSSPPIDDVIAVVDRRDENRVNCTAIRERQLNNLTTSSKRIRNYLKNVLERYRIPRIRRISGGMWRRGGPPTARRRTATVRRSLLVTNEESVMRRNQIVDVNRHQLDVVSDGGGTSGTSSVLHIQLHSIDDVTKIMERLGDEFSIDDNGVVTSRLPVDPRIPGAGGRPRFDLASSPKTTTPAPVTTATEGRRRNFIPNKPKWMTRGHVCRIEVRRTRGWTQQRLRKVRRHRKCRTFPTRFVCVVKYGRTRITPSITNVWRCCKGFQLSKDKSKCRPQRHSKKSWKASSRHGRRPSTPAKRVRIANSSPHTTASSPIIIASSPSKPSKKKRKRKKKKKSKTQQAPTFDTPYLENFTTFVPTDQILKQENENRKRNNQLNHILDNSVIPYKIIYSKDVKNNQIFNAVSGNPIRFNIYDDLMTVNCRNISSRDQPLDTLVYHVINGLLNDVTGTIGDFVRERPQRFYLLNSAIERLDMSGRFSSPSSSPLTLFAPTDDALSSLPLSIEEESLECLRHLVNSHVVDDVFCSTAAEINFPATTNSGFPLISYLKFNSSFVNDAELIKRDIMATNGVVHVVKHLLYKVESLADILESELRLTDFYEMLLVGDVIDELMYARNTTLISPNNLAFHRLSDRERMDLLSDSDLLRKRLSYHVVKSVADVSVWKNQITRQFRLEAKSTGKPVHVSHYVSKIEVQDDGSGHKKLITSTAISVQCSRVSHGQPKKWKSCAGALLVLDEIMPLPSSSLLAVLAEREELSTILGIIRSLHLEEFFEDAATDHTFLAPTNQVFDRFASFVRDELFNNVETARRIITFHLLNGYRCKDELLQRPYRHLTMNGQPVISCPKQDRVLLGRNRRKLRASILTFNLIADNGIVHAIDNLLLPKHYNAVEYPEEVITAI